MFLHTPCSFYVMRDANATRAARRNWETETAAAYVKVVVGAKYARLICVAVYLQIFGWLLSRLLSSIWSRRLLE